MKESWKLITLLVIAIGGLLAFAFLPGEFAENIPLKQVDMAALMDKDEKALELNDAALREDSAVNEPVDTTSQTVLLFGDSMSENLGLRLADYTNKNGHKLICVTWVGSSTFTWAKSDTLQHYVKRFHPTHVFVCLGSNELYTADMKSCERRIRAILAKIGNIPTVWIGPPNWCEDHGYNKLLAEVMGPRRYYPSYKLTFERLDDGRHPTMKSSSMWMDKIIEWINQGHSVHPFRMEKPDKRDRRYKQITILPLGTKRKAVADTTKLEAPSTQEVLENANTESPILHKDSVR